MSPRHQHVQMLATLLGEPLASAYGHVAALYHWCEAHAIDGDVAGVCGRELADACLYTDKPAVLIEAMVQARVLSPSPPRLLVRNWPAIAPMTVHRALIDQRRTFGSGAAPSRTALSDLAADDRPGARAWIEEAERRGLAASTPGPAAGRAQLHRRPGGLPQQGPFSGPMPTPGSRVRRARPQSVRDRTWAGWSIEADEAIARWQGRWPAVDMAACDRIRAVAQLAWLEVGPVFVADEPVSLAAMVVEAIREFRERGEPWPGWTLAGEAITQSLLAGARRARGCEPADTTTTEPS
jgi:hypothetical protein